MMYYLHLFSDQVPGLNVFSYVTFRAVAAAITAFAISLIFGNFVIRKLISLKVGQPIRTAAEVHRLAELHGGKAGIPTMGGVLIIGAVFISGQVYEFTAFVKEGMGFTTNVAASAFFTLTGFHGVHVSLGILMLMSLFVMSLRGRLPVERAETVEIVGLYWHFVDVVWILIFTVVYLIK